MSDRLTNAPDPNIPIGYGKVTPIGESLDNPSRIHKIKLNTRYRFREVDDKEFPGMPKPEPLPEDTAPAKRGHAYDDTAFCGTCGYDKHTVLKTRELAQSNGMPYEMVACGRCGVVRIVPL